MPPIHFNPADKDDRPTTARPPSSPDFYYDDHHLAHHQPQYTYSSQGDTLEEEEDDEDDEDDESEDEDVFAYLPPTTADLQQQQLQQQQQQQQQQHQTPFAHNLVADACPDRPKTQHGERPVTVASSFSPSNFNSPDIIPGAAISPTAPSFHHTHSDSYPSTLPPITPFSNIPVDTPPSTDSQNDPNDPYRMRRLDTAQTNTDPPASQASGGAASRLSVPTGSERGLRVELPSPGMLQQSPPPTIAENEKDSEIDEIDAEMSKKIRPTSVDSTELAASAASVSPSMMEFSDIESRESIKMGFDFDAVEEEDSPYPEVRASVSNVDDPEMPALTFRMWVIGLILCMIGSGMNVFFNFRQPAPQVIPLVLVLVSYPIGKLAAYSLPIRTFRSRLPIPWPVRFGGRGWKGIEFSFSLNPGPWNIKEHVLVYIMANVAVGNPYALNAIVVAEVFYNIKHGFWFNLVTVLATQLTGFGLAGLCRRFLVWPASMVWPQNLVACTLLNTLHAEDDAESNGLSRYRYYVMASVASFFFFFFPGFIFTALSVFNWITWIVPNNVPVNQLFGVYSGLGMSVLTFDWTQISWVGSPLMVPWWAECHVFAGFVMFFWILTPVLYYTNVWDLGNFPISANEPYDRFGNAYNISRIITADNQFNLTAYDEYSPLYLPATYAVTYLLAFTLSTCVIVHTLLYHGRSLLNGIKNIKIEKDDIHAKLMRNYPEVPDWWYLLVFVFFFGMAIVAAEVWHTGVPVWALLISVLLPVVYVLPSGFIFAMTGQGITLNLLAQIIPGVLLPGNPMANMVFKAYSVQTLTEATMFVQDLKLGHYIKVPPRATFLGVKEWMFSNVKDICTDTQKSNLTCPHNQVFFTASAVWGLIGPKRQFGADSIYHPQLYAIIIGAFLPLPFWLWQRRRPNSWIRYVSTPIILNGVSFIPPATGINYSSWFFFGFIFQYLIRRRNFGWWSKFNYVTSAAMDSGTVLSLITIFFTLQFPKGGGISLNWWGNSVYANTADYRRTPFRTTPPEGLS
ncbi:OPT oligopeptide transporter [Sanghuangporus baumii]|uniref:OPT oligopeptide transporter n=1 Tax=Sanghuangporus baumii TaxID=108892 RepID=A0A9Q5I251_SANBA|nr:OPT oligopeptide transporter [Sanghuangporus baumii]